MGDALGALAAAGHQHVANAVRAFGTIVTVEPPEFQKILDAQSEALVVLSEGGFFKTTHQYLTSFKGLAFFTKSSEPLLLPADAVLVRAVTIQVPHY